MKTKSFADVISKKRVESLRNNLGLLEGISPVVCLVWKETIDESKNQQLSKWYRHYVKVTSDVDTKVNNRNATFLVGYVDSNWLRDLYKTLSTVSDGEKPVIEECLTAGLEESRIKKIDQWLGEFREVLYPTSEQAGFEFPKLTKTTLQVWWSYFQYHLPAIIPALCTTRSFASPLPVGTFEERTQALTQKEGPVFEAGEVITTGDMAIETEHMLDHLLDWIDAGFPSRTEQGDLVSAPTKPAVPQTGTIEASVSKELANAVPLIATDVSGGNGLTPETEPPPPFDPASTDWILGKELAKLLKTRTSLMSDSRKLAIDQNDEHGRWGTCSFGTFRRKVAGQQVGYYIPRLAPEYRSKYEHARNG